LVVTEYKNTTNASLWVKGKDVEVLYPTCLSALYSCIKKQIDRTLHSSHTDIRTLHSHKGWS